MSPATIETVAMIARLAAELAKLLQQGSALVLNKADDTAHAKWRRETLAKLESASRKERALLSKP